MIQLYFLSILCNGLSGYILFADNTGEDLNKEPLSFNNPTFHLVLGILGAVTGFLKILSPLHDKAYIVGDLLPAVAGIVAGFLLIFGIYRKEIYSISESDKSLDYLASSLLRFRKPLGLAVFIIALLHFIFPSALFL